MAANQDNKDLCEKAISLSNAIISGQYRPLLGVRMLVPYLHELNIAFDKRFTGLIGIDSETDYIPLEDHIRKLWNSDALVQLDIEANEYEEKVKAGIFEDCKILIEELQKWISK
jgi:hypothetical protein